MIFKSLAFLVIFLSASVYAQVDIITGKGLTGIAKCERPRGQVFFKDGAQNAVLLEERNLPTSLKTLAADILTKSGCYSLSASEKNTDLTLQATLLSLTVTETGGGRAMDVFTSIFNNNGHISTIHRYEVRVEVELKQGDISLTKESGLIEGEFVYNRTTKTYTDRNPNIMVAGWVSPEKKTAANMVALALAKAWNGAAKKLGDGELVVQSQ